MAPIFGGDTVMFWTAISVKSKTLMRVCFACTKMKSANYIELLDEVLTTYFAHTFDEERIFPHESVSTKYYTIE